MKVRWPRLILFWLTLAITLIVAPSAQAHLMNTGFGPFYDGLTHLFVTPEDLLPVIARGVGVFPIQKKKVVYPILEVAVIDLINKPVIAIVELILRTGKEDLAIGLAQRILVIPLSLLRSLSIRKRVQYAS